SVYPPHGIRGAAGWALRVVCLTLVRRAGAAGGVVGGWGEVLVGGCGGGGVGGCGCFCVGCGFVGWGSVCCWGAWCCGCWWVVWCGVLGVGFCLGGRLRACVFCVARGSVAVGGAVLRAVASG
ncbi:hypothetical protein RA268_27980, partial [Pseudomonas syringae pv. tagetis]